MALLTRARFIPLLALFAGLGCGAEHESPQRTTISGIVRYRGVALQGGLIVFSSHPGLDSQGVLVWAPIAPDGSFHLVMESAGLRPGHYRMAVSSPPNAYWPIPRGYNDPAASGLRCTIEADQPLYIKLELD
jgi:hypothetical protein